MQLNQAAGTCIIKYQEVAHARAAQVLTNTPLGDRPLVVTEYSSETSILPTAAQGVAPTAAQLEQAAIADQRADEVARTIYVGNVNTALTDEHLKEFFSSCGPVVITKLAGDADGNRPTRFAFVEFEHIESAHKAIAIAGTMLAGYPLKIRKANNAILKPTTAPAAPKKDLTDIMAKVLAATQKISEKAVEKVKEKKKSRSRSRSKSRDRSRRSRRSRSRSRDRSRRSRRSRSRDRDRSRRGEVKCYNCGERGHISRNCRKSRSRSRSPPKKKAAPDRTGMFFNGYKWEPIESLQGATDPTGTGVVVPGTQPSFQFTRTHAIIAMCSSRQNGCMCAHPLVWSESA